MNDTPAAVSSVLKHDGIATLSSREIEVLRCIASGLSNDEVAKELYLGINTIKTYIRTAYRKIGVDRRSQAVLWAIENGLIEIPGYRLVPVNSKPESTPRAG
jgi:DNA-binding NarL/FixJ family response regulator